MIFISLENDRCCSPSINFLGTVVYVGTLSCSCILQQCQKFGEDVTVCNQDHFFISLQKQCVKNNQLFDTSRVPQLRYYENFINSVS